jgi:shikimate kinase
MQLGRPSIIELVGPAGAGKSTLARLLSQCDKDIFIAADFQMRKIDHAPYFMRSIPFLTTVLLNRCQDRPGYTWEQIKFLVYLKSWTSVVRHPTLSRYSAILLDHGPVFKLATLNAFSPERISGQACDHWGRALLHQWANTLDLIIWLDAPDAVLRERINQRKQAHAVKDKSERVAYDFLARYRSSYDVILEELTAKGVPTILRFDTSQSSIEQIADWLLVSGEINQLPAPNHLFQPSLIARNKDF